MNIYSDGWKYVKKFLFVFGILLAGIPPVAILPWVGVLYGYPETGMYYDNNGEEILAFGRYIIKSKNFIIPIPCFVIIAMAMGGSFIIMSRDLEIMLMGFEKWRTRK